jgi:hypothetical protein
VGARNARSNPGTFRDERKPCERLACGVAAAEHAKQRVGSDLAVEAEVGCGGAGPPAGGFTVAEVVILDARRDLGQVAVDAVHAGELADVQHPTTATGGPRTRRVQLCDPLERVLSRGNRKSPLVGGCGSWSSSG